ncbi:hypothetical protein OCAR_5544 [Afipia carboxidovorans OM5]|uniref:Uncharacterized protein n=1 Tax=Afipia carboxidovorans (strain ATCC 49405 / DSM 1227 / KCTC 32145 / OM5) TaxID=504832 RepID=B6JI08_AFIC5|nr:hypothetical protein [Afipia carboxidovorans]ACI92675.1 hypothetical protein OCAR_5544 [Afipia carboxidovorans OM5]AEI03570.1 hypothetical protein OCA4_c24500 [Afipia carboxidovorans OM4]AEI07147.1 hypothetical protein OCA5_c24510 [Afipia carboxidovorans OM5]
MGVIRSHKTAARAAPVTVALRLDNEAVVFEGKAALAVTQTLKKRDGVIACLLKAVEMVRDADEDCRKDGLPQMPPAARAKLDAAIAKAHTMGKRQ